MQVDVEKVLADKAPKLAKKLPRFLINYLKKIVHQDEINHIMASYGEMKPYEFIHNALEFMGVSWLEHRRQTYRHIPKVPCLRFSLRFL